MSKTVLILFAVCVGLSLLSLHLVKQLRSGQTTIADLQAKVATLERQQAETPSPSSQAPEPSQGATFQIEQIAPPPKAAVIVQTPRPFSMAPTVAFPSVEERMRMLREASERQRQLMQDPEYREAMRLQQRTNMRHQYPGIGEAMGLTEEQTEELFDLLADQQLRGNDRIEFPWDADGLDPADLQQRQENARQQWAEVQRKNEAELAAQLGPDKLQAWKEYQSTRGARHRAEQLRSTLAGRGVPLSEDARRAIVKVYAEAQQAEAQEYAKMAGANAGSSAKGAVAMVHVGPTPETLERQLEFAKKRNQRVLDALSPYLTYEQREAVQKEQEAGLKMQEAQMRIMRAQSKVGATNDVGWVPNSAQAFSLPDQ